MQIIICGAGEVGYTLASSLASEGHSVVVIDSKEDSIRELNAELDVQALVGDARYPDVLRAAGADDADMLIGVESLSESNLLVGVLGRNIFKIPIIAVRLWSKAFRSDEWRGLTDKGALKVDYFIEPEKDVARLILDTVRVAGAMEVFYFSRSDVQVTGLRVRDDCPLIYTPIRQLTEIFPYQTASILLIRREGKIIVADANTSMYPGDEVFFINNAAQSWRTVETFGFDPLMLDHYLIVGGGNVGIELVNVLEQESANASITIIESDRNKAKHLAERFPKASVICGSILDERVLNEINMLKIDALLAVTNSDETNAFGALLGKKRGVKRVVALIAHNAHYPDLLGELEIDVFINPQEVTVSGILQYVRRGKVKSVHSVFEGKAEIVEFEALETSDIVQKRLEDIRIPKGARIGCIVREQEGFIRPDKNTVIRKGDLVVLAVRKEAMKEVEKLFSVQLDYF